MANIKTLLNRFFSVINAENNNFKRTYSSTLFEPASLTNLQAAAQSCYVNKAGGYECNLSPIIIDVPNVPRDCSNPSGLNKIGVILEVSAIFSKPDTTKIIDPLVSLNFVTIVFSKEPVAFISWHLDKQGDAKSSDHIHPEYHITLGGNYITKAKRGELTTPNEITGSRDFGQSLLIGTPRFMHPPMEIILGIDFILNHYVAKSFASIFIENEEYISIVNEMKNILWCSYAIGFAKNYYNDLSNSGRTVNIDNSFVSSILG